MSKTIDDGGAAFPRPTAEITGQPGIIDQGQIGMSLRDWFAGQVLTGMQLWDAILNQRETVFGRPGGGDKMSKIAYKLADAMIAERSK